MIASDSAVRGDERPIAGSEDSEIGYLAHMLRRKDQREICSPMFNRIPCETSRAPRKRAEKTLRERDSSLLRRFLLGAQVFSVFPRPGNAEAARESGLGQITRGTDLI